MHDKNRRNGTSELRRRHLPFARACAFPCRTGWPYAASTLHVPKEKGTTHALAIALLCISHGRVSVCTNLPGQC